MDLRSLVVGGIAASIFLSVLVIGAQTSFADLRSLSGRPGLLLRSLLAMNVAAPLIAIAVCKLFSLHPALVVGLVTLSIAPVGALFSQAVVPLVSAGRSRYAQGLYFASTALSVVLTPVAVEVIGLFQGGDMHLSPLVVAEVVLGSVLLPLGAGLAAGHLWPSVRGWMPALEKASSLLLLACALVILASVWTPMLALAREGTFIALLLLNAAGLFAGHWLGGPDEDDRTVLALATVSRHPGVAVAVAGLADERLAALGVLLAVLAGELVALPYKRWRKKRVAGAGAGASSRNPVEDSS